MIIPKPYDRVRAVEYARRWALSRNPLFYDFTGGGGNCTNFVSQCLYAGSLVMDLTPVFGWYYNSLDDRSPSWTGVGALYEYLLGLRDFMPTNERIGPFGKETERGEIEVGDIVQLQNAMGIYYHSLLVSDLGKDGEIYICANSNDSLDRPLSTYNYANARFIHINAVNIDIPDENERFEALLEGREYSPQA